MIKNIIMPKMGQTMEEGSIERWVVKEGEFVEKGQVVMEIATDKAVLDVESLVEGEVLKIVVPVGQTVTVGTTVAYVGKRGDVLPDETGERKEVAE